MTPARETYYKGLFFLAAVYDLSLGIVFTFCQDAAFRMLGIGEKLPAFRGYLSLIGAFVFVIGCAYCLICLGDLRRNRDLITVGALYKLAYSAVAFYYFAAGNVPHPIFVVVFGVADLVFFVLMAECRLFLRTSETGGGAAVFVVRGESDSTERADARIDNAWGASYILHGADRRAPLPRGG